MKSNRPVVALDIDGCLNAGGSPSYLGEGWEIHRVEMPAADLPDSPFIGGYGEQDLSIPVCINPSLHGTWITKLREHVDVVWATTWEHAANKYLAPLLGIDPLPVGISVRVQLPRFGDAKNHDSTAWKAMALGDAFRGRSLVWVDDYNESYADPVWWDHEPAMPTRCITCDPQTGLAAGQMAEVDAFVDEMADYRIQYDSSSIRSEHCGYPAEHSRNGLCQRWATWRRTRRVEAELITDDRCDVHATKAWRAGLVAEGEVGEDDDDE